MKNFKELFSLSLYMHMFAYILRSDDYLSQNALSVAVGRNKLSKGDRNDFGIYEYITGCKPYHIAITVNP